MKSKGILAIYLPTYLQETKGVDISLKSVALKNITLFLNRENDVDR